MCGEIVVIGKIKSNDDFLGESSLLTVQLL